MATAGRPQESIPYARSITTWAMQMLATCAFIILTACETTETTTAVSMIETLPELALVTTLDTLSNVDAEKARAKLEVRYPRAVYVEAITPVYWRDDLHADLVLFVTVGGRTQMVKVEVVGARRYHVTSGTRNGRSFRHEGLVSANQ